MRVIRACYWTVTIILQLTFALQLNERYVRTSSMDEQHKGVAFNKLHRQWKVKLLMISATTRRFSLQTKKTNLRGQLKKIGDASLLLTHASAAVDVSDRRLNRECEKYETIKTKRRARWNADVCQTGNYPEKLFWSNSKMRCVATTCIICNFIFIVRRDLWPRQRAPTFPKASSSRHKCTLPLARWLKSWCRD